MIYLLLGPSGSGKSTLGSCLRDMGMPELISHSTRPMREGESEGNPYHFVTREQFEQIPMIEFTEYAGNLYGTSKAEVERVIARGSSAFVIVDRHGVDAFSDLYRELVRVIYVYVPVSVLWQRMADRGDSLELINERIKHAVVTGETNNFDIADFCIINRDLDASIRQLKAIIE